MANGTFPILAANLPRPCVFSFRLLGTVIQLFGNRPDGPPGCEDWDNQPAACQRVRVWLE